MRTVLGGLGILAALGSVSSCGNTEPCTTACPKVEGSYAMTYKIATVESPDCAALPAPAGPATVTITRSGAELRSTIFGVAFRGMLQDSSDFSLAGSEEPDGGTDAGTQSFTLRGYYVPALSRADGGEPASINGKWVTHTERGAKICDAEQPFTGIKK